MLRAKRIIRAKRMVAVLALGGLLALALGELPALGPVSVARAGEVARAGGSTDASLGASQPLSQTIYLPAVVRPAPAATPEPTPEPTPGTPGLPAFPVNIQSRASVEAFFNAYHEAAPAANMGWTGNHASCDAGTTSAEYRASLQNLVNFFRSMAGVPATVTFRDDYNAKAQQAALMMSVNADLDHSPPPSWRCYSEEGDEAAGRSNLSLWWGGSSDYHGIKGQMRDRGSGNYAVGHRRWILCPMTQEMGTGDVPENGDNVAANALWVFDDNTWGPRPAVRDDFVAWPPAGYVPYSLFYDRWSFSHPDANFDNAVPSVRYNGAALPVQVEPLQHGYCENTLVWVPTLPWLELTSDAEHRLDVEIANVLVDGQPRTYTYSVTLFYP